MKRPVNIPDISKICLNPGRLNIHINFYDFHWDYFASNFDLIQLNKVRDFVGEFSSADQLLMCVYFCHFREKHCGAISKAKATREDIRLGPAAVEAVSLMNLTLVC